MPKRNSQINFERLFFVADQSIQPYYYRILKSMVIVNIVQHIEENMKEERKRSIEAKTLN